MFWWQGGWMGTMMRRFLVVSVLAASVGCAMPEMSGRVPDVSSAGAVRSGPLPAARAGRDASSAWGVAHPASAGGAPQAMMPAAASARRDRHGDALNHVTHRVEPAGKVQPAGQVLRYFGQTESGYQSRVPYGNHPEAGRRVDADGTRIYYEVHGQGEPVVVLHGGLAGSMADMAEFIDCLARDHQVIAIATRGHGKSEIGHETPSYHRKAKDVLAVLDEVTKRPATVIGFSDGAYTGYFLAADHPERVKRLVAIGAGVWTKGSRQFGGTLADLQKLDPAYWQQQMQVRPEPERAEAWYQTSLSYYNQLVVDRDVLGRIRVPVLVMAGEDDANAPLDTVVAAWRMIPDARLAIIPDAPHAVFVANFPAVWASMKPFMAR